MDLQSRVHGNSRGAAARLMRISCGATHEKEEWRNRDHQLPASRFPQKLYTRTPWGSSHVVCALARSGARCKQNAGQADRAWGGARKCSDAERNATSVFLAAGQQFLAGIDRLIAQKTYTVDLNSETLHMRTRLYAVMSGRTWFFKVEIAGKISGGTFVVRNPVHGAVIMQVEEERFRQASFFLPRWLKNNLDRFKSAARENGYYKADKYQGGSVVWFTQMPSDGGRETLKRLCIDSLTDSVTVFWQTVPAKLNSKTFRTVSSLEEWFGLISD